MFELLRSLRRNQRLLKDFVKRDLKARYVGSSMGFFWSVIFPIINLFVYMFVFRLILKMRWADNQGPGDVLMIIFTGVLVWSAFAETVSRSTNTLVDNANLIQKVVFPAEVLPVYLAISSLINMSIGLPILVGGVVWFGYVSPVDPPAMLYTVQQAGLVDPPYRPLALGSPLILLPVLFLLQSVFTVGLGYVLSALNMLVRDTFHLVGVFITVWMFSTPIFYPAQMVHNAGYTWVLEINPMFWLIEAYREVMIYAAWPDWSELLRFAAVAGVVFFLGSRFFMSQKKRFPDLL